MCQTCNLLSPLFADRGWAGIGKRGDCFYLLRMVTRMGRRLLTLYWHVYIPLHVFFIVLVYPHWHFLGSNLWFPPDCMWSSILCGVSGLWPSQCWEWRWTPDRSRAAATPPPPISLEPGPCNSSQIPLRAWVCFSRAVEHAHSSLTLPWTLHCHLPPKVSNNSFFKKNNKVTLH